jgi:hypothetical protein
MNLIKQTNVKTDFKLSKKEWLRIGQQIGRRTMPKKIAGPLKSPNYALPAKMAESLVEFANTMSPYKPNEMLIQILLNLSLKFEELQLRMLMPGEEIRSYALGPIHHRTVEAILCREATYTLSFVGFHYGNSISNSNSCAAKFLIAGDNQLQTAKKAINILMEVATAREKDWK